MSNVLELTQDNFETVLSTHPLLLLDFWADWCQPCQAFHEVMTRVAQEYPEFTFARVNIEENPALAKEFQVASIPMIMILRDQVVVYHDSGALTPTSLRELLDKTKDLDMTSV